MRSSFSSSVALWAAVLSFVLALWCVTPCVSVGVPDLDVHVVQDFHFMESLKSRRTFERQHRADGSAMHDVLISVKKLNVKAFQEMVLERSDPKSPLFQKWFTYDQVTDIVKNPTAFDAVKSWLDSHNIAISWISNRQDYIRAEAPIKKWEQLLNAQFYVFFDHSYRLGSGNADAKPTAFTRCLSYSIPLALKPHIDSIFQTVQVPFEYRKSYHMKEHPEHGFPAKTLLRASPMAIKGDVIMPHTEVSSSPSYVTVSYLNQYYEISSNSGSATLNQSVFETSTQYFSQSDLLQFQQTFGLTEQAAVSIGGHSISTCPTYSTKYSPSCVEGNLDIQYIMGVAQTTGSIFWYVPNSNTDPFLQWLVDIVNDSNPPQSNSMSWGSIEQNVASSTMNSFNTEASLLAGMGVTIVISSGDDGVSNYNCECNSASGSNVSDWTGTSWHGVGYFPSFPASCPWVTAVGATMGAGGSVPAVGTDQLACQSQLGGVITTGGGFSTYYDMPSWQKKSVDLYFSRLGTDQPAQGYNPKGRAYPDVALVGVSYEVIIGGNPYPIYGTSASAPVFAAMVTLVNTLRQEAGLSMIGFINPLLYEVNYNLTAGLGVTLDNNVTAANLTVDDVTSGQNNCCAYNGATPSLATCCTSGFTAAQGWDPVTGWGSIPMPTLAAIFGTTAPYVPQSSGSNKKSDSALVIALSVIFVVLAVILIVGGIFMCCCRAQSPNPSQTTRSLSLNQPIAAANVQVVTAPVVPVVVVSQNPIYQ